MIDAAAFAGWLWPVPITNGRTPIVSNGFADGERYKPDGSMNYATHLGLDLMFPRIATDPTGPASNVALFKHGLNPGYITWPGTIVRAAGPGKIWSAGPSRLGDGIELDHGKVGGVPMLTFYQHLVSFARPWQHGDVVNAGDVLGVMGGDPANYPHLVHLHFEVWLPAGKPRRGDWPVDPAAYLKLWSH